jgi:hypothetical protein
MLCMGAETVKLGMAAARAVAPEAVVAVTELAEAAAGNLLRREAGLIGGEVASEGLSRALVPMFRNETYLAKGVGRITLRVPTEEAISFGKYELAEEAVKANRARLTEVLQRNWNDVPLTGFHGATKGGAEFINRNRTAQSVYGNIAALDVGAIETKSQNAAQLFTDMEFAAKGASTYAFKPWLRGAQKEAPGALFVFRMGELGTDMEYAGQKHLLSEVRDSWGGKGGLFDWTGTTKYAGRSFAEFEPSTFEHTMIGSIGANELEAMGFNKTFVPVSGHGLGGDWTKYVRIDLHSVNADQQLMARTMELLGFLKKI